MLKPLIHSEEGGRVFGKAALVKVPTGARYLTRTPPDEPRWREYHRDQNLASFGELGLPLSTSLMIEGKQVPLRLLLQDSIANFHLQQRELEWTGIAYALYLPPVAGWTNRFGEEYTFDDLAMNLLDRPLTGASCGGMHVLYTLMVISRADAESPVLSQAVRSKVEGRLQSCAKLAVDRQKSDGSWAGDWLLDTELSRDYTGPSPPATPDHQLLITGHTAEWLLYLPRDFRVPDETLKRAGHWLLSRLKKLDAKAKKAQLCPCTHAVCVLQNLSFPEGTSGLGSLGHGIDPAWAGRVRVSFRVPRTED